MPWFCCPTEDFYVKPTDRKNIALMVYGQFRSYKNNLKKNIEMLEPILKTHNIHVFVLTDKKSSGNYSIENEKEIRDIFKNFYFNLHVFGYIENYDNAEEIKTANSFLDNIKNNNGFEGPFVPVLVYRKYLLNRIKNEYISSHNINIDLTIYCRLFDIKIKNNLSFPEIENSIGDLYNNKTHLYGSSDTFFLGSQDAIDYLFDLSEKFKSGKLYHDDIWQDKDFVNFLSAMDICLCNCKATYAPEIQTIAHMYYSSYTYKNIRFDFNNPSSELNKNALYHVILDPARKNKYMEY